MRRCWGVAVVVACAVAALGQQPQDPEAVLRRTRDRVLADLERMPRYTCVQNINRRYYSTQARGATCSAIMAAHESKSEKLKLRGWDRLRLDVAIAGGENVYSWVGAPRFESGQLEQLAGEGPLSTGDFGPFLFSIFNGARVTYAGEKNVGGRQLFAYSYEMSAERSKYYVKGKHGWNITAYRGTMLLDPEGNDIATLTVRSAELSHDNAECQVISEVEYGRMPIHDRPVLMPRQTTLITLDRDGSEAQSLTTYASCREYTSNVRLLFDSHNDSPNSTATSPQSSTTSAPERLPAGLHFRGRIMTTIDSNTSAAGDPIEAVLVSPLRDKQNQVLAPAGARMHARLVGMEQRSSRFDYFRVSLQFESIEINGRTVALSAAPQASLSNAGGMGGLPRPVTLNYGSPEITVFIRPEEHLVMKKFEWDWITLPDHKTQPKTLPAGLHFRARIVTPIDSDTAVADDPIEAVLLSPISGKDGRELARAGAGLHGHLLALKQYKLKSSGDQKFHSYVEVLVRFEFIDLDGGAVPLRAAPDLDVFGGDGAYGQNMFVIPDQAIGQNLFFFSVQHVHLENFDWGWTTVPEQPSPPQTSPGTFPAGAQFRARVVTPIDSETAAAGDPIEGVLLSPIRSKDGREWAPAGARLRGRLLGLKPKELQRPAQSVLEVLMQFESIELNGSDVPLRASPDPSDLSGVSTGAGLYLPEVSVRPHDVLKTNFFIFRKQHLHLENFDWNWTTLPEKQSPAQDMEESGTGASPPQKQ